MFSFLCSTVVKFSADIKAVVNSHYRSSNDENVIALIDNFSAVVRWCSFRVMLCRCWRKTTSTKTNISTLFNNTFASFV